MASDVASFIGGGALGTLLLRLTADSSRLLKGMKESEGAVKAGVDRMSTQLKLFQRASIGAFTAAAGAFSFFTKQAINGADEMNRLAQVAGQTVEQFSGLATAANMAEVSAQDLATASRFLSQSMEKAGINSKNLTEEIIKQAAVFAKMEDGSAKIRMATEKFGRAGASLIPFLNQGSAAIRAQIEEAEELGNVIGSEFGRNADTFNDNLTRINNAFKGIFNVVAAELLPVWIEMQERFIEWVKETNAVRIAAGFLLELFENVTFAAKRLALGVLAVWTAMKTLGALIGSAIAMAFELILNHIDGVVRIFGVLIDAIGGIIIGLRKMADVAALAGKALSSAFKGNFSEALKAAQAIPNAIGQGWDQVVASVKQGATAAGGIVVDTLSKDFGIVKSISESTVETIGDQWLGFLDTGEKLLQPVEVRAKAVQDTVKKITQDIEANSRQAKELLEKVGTPQRQALDPFTNQSLGVMKEEAEAQAKLKILEDFAARKLELDKETNEALAAAMEAHNARIRDLQIAQAQVVVQSGQNMFDSLAEAARGFAGEQSDIYKALFAASKAFAIAESIIKIQQGVANALSLPYPANIAAAASVVAAAANIVSTISSVQLEFGGERARGGPVSPGKSFLVGERGPEMFSPRSAGTIIPNDRLGGGGTKVIINNYTDAKAQVSERDDGTGKVIEVILKRVKNDIASELRDGRGDVNRAMESSYGLRRGTR